MIKNFFKHTYIYVNPFLKKIKSFFLNIGRKVKFIYGSKPLFQQKTFIRGLGKVEIGKDCVFGFNLGGFHYKGSIELQARTKNAKIFLGDEITTNNNVFICSAGKISIGSRKH